MNHHHTSASVPSAPPAPPAPVALVGPGRAGTAVASVLGARGHRIVSVAGRDPGAPSTRAAAARFGAEAVAVADAGGQAGLVVLAVPDREIESVAGELAPGLEPGALVVHLAGSRGVDALAVIARTRSDVELGALHPLQTLTVPEAGAAAFGGAWAAVAGPACVTELALELGLRPFVVADDRRAAYHAAAAVASNHLVALLAQVQRIARGAGVPFEAFVPLARAALANVESAGPAAALTGPVARGDDATVAGHLHALGPDDRVLYRALAREALALTGRDDPVLAARLADEPVERIPA